MWNIILTYFEKYPIAAYVHVHIYSIFNTKHHLVKRFDPFRRWVVSRHIINHMPLSASVWCFIPKQITVCKLPIIVNNNPQSARWQNLAVEDTIWLEEQKHLYFIAHMSDWDAICRRHVVVVCVWSAVTLNLGEKRDILGKLIYGACVVILNAKTYTLCIPTSFDHWSPSSWHKNETRYVNDLWKRQV